MPIHWHPRAATGRLISERTRDGTHYRSTLSRPGAEKPRFSNPFYSRAPFPLALDDPGSVLAVKGTLRALDGSGPIRKTRCLRGEGGGVGPWGARASG